MGGYGSGQKGSKIKVEDCTRLSISPLVRKKFLADGLQASGTVSWTYGGSTSPYASIGFTANALDPHNATLGLNYTITDRSTGEKTPYDYSIPLEYTTPHFGGKRWWMRCALFVNGRECNRRVSILYLPPGGRYFGCRHCYRLIYESSCDSHKYDRMFALIGAEHGISGKQAEAALKREWA